VHGCAPARLELPDTHGKKLGWKTTYVLFEVAQYKKLGVFGVVGFV